MRLVMPKWVLNLASNIYLSYKPLFILYHPDLHRIKGREVRSVLESVEAGDVLLRQWRGYLNTIFTPGQWSHAGLYVGESKVIHALGKGVVEEDILDFCRTDSIAVMRPIDGGAESAIEKARELIGSEYDYQFESGDQQYYCSELCDACYDQLFKDDYTTIAGNFLLTPDAIRHSEHVSTVLEIRH